MPHSAGLHHVTAIAGEPRRNVGFYTRTLGLRLVKRTVNFDDPGTWHLYYGDAAGAPGSILTFFPWEGVAPGRLGAGETHETAFAVPEGSLDAWEVRLAEAGVEAGHQTTRFGAKALPFADPDGMRLALVETAHAPGTPWDAAGIPAAEAIRGFGGVTLAVGRPERTASVLTDIFGWTRVASEGDRERYAAPGGALGRHVDLVATAAGRGRPGAGSVHHIAFRAETDAAQAEMVGQLSERLGLQATPQQDRNYFRSVYFREPSGVLFEIATDAPGFDADEPAATMGSTLKLPAWLEPQRDRIAAALAPLD